MIQKKKEVSCNSLSRKEKLLLHYLLRDGRMFNTTISKKLGISSQVTGRIRKNLERDGVIKGYSTELNHNFLGIKTFVLVFFNFNESELPIMTNNLISLYKVLANSITHIGLYGFRNLEDSDKYFNSLIKDSENIKIISTYIFPAESIIKHCSKNLCFDSINNFNGKGSCRSIKFQNRLSKNIKPLNNSEKEILRQLIKKGNISCKKISANLNKKISRSSVNRSRIKLEKTGIIRKYNIELDYEKLGIKVLAFIFVRPNPEILKNQGKYIKECHKSRKVIGCYRLNEETALFCGFKDLNDLESYVNGLRCNYKDLIEIKHIHIICPNGVLKESFDDLYLSILNY
jgi:DNA-binding Lrp family transcriptional regulator